MGFPTWTLWGMGASAVGALLAIALAFLAQSPRLLTRLNLNGQRLDLRAKSFTGYGLALLLLAFGFFVAGVPLGEQAGAPVAEASGDATIAVLAPSPGRAFTTDEAINFDWFWPATLADGERFIVYLIDDSQSYNLGSLDAPNNGAAYRLTIDGVELPAVGETLTWQVRLETAGGDVLAEGDALPLAVVLAGGTPGATNGQSGAMIGLATEAAELGAGETLTDTEELALPPGVVTGTATTEGAAVFPTDEATPEPTVTPSPIPSATPTPTPAPTLTPTPIAGPTARVGDETSTLPLRRLPGGPVLVVLVRGDTVIPLSGHAYYDTEVWREISTVDGMIGWVPDRFLVYPEE